MDEVRRSFSNIKEDFELIKKELEFVKADLFETKKVLEETCKALIRLDFSIKDIKNRTLSFQTQKGGFPTQITQNKTDSVNLNLRKGQILGISTGNEGVQTDRQTNRQTDRQINFSPPLKEETFSKGDFELKEKNSFEEALTALNSIDNLKKELRLKFKKLTPQEILVFSAIYQLEEEKGSSNYKSLSSRLNLTESSIRDYVRRLILKEIPLKKEKEKNKEVKIYISETLKKVVSLDTILKLVDL
ncbi:MAG: hypothetical protein NUV46_01965 [Nanoarchaeota archaeon]|nr:hypothetical protein [Nanoarchaeota archaeon]